MFPNALDDLVSFEVPRAAVEPFLRTFRLTNTAIDALFYDVGALYWDLLARGTVLDQGTSAETAAPASFARPLRELDLGALSNPEGAILVVDAERPPFVHRCYRDVGAFLADLEAGRAAERPLDVVTLTGVGSSALGSAAFAWNVSTALARPVAAIVPGYGLADVVYQALGGWFGFGLHDWIRTTTQRHLAAIAPSLAAIGRNLTETAPGHAVDPNTDAPVFRHGSVGSDTLHAILERDAGITRVVGHSKGALAIANAVRSLPGDVAALDIVTLGCAIGEEYRTARYDQFLGRLDAIGVLNSWGHLPGTWLFTHHSTNTSIPLSMSVAELLASRQVPAAALRRVRDDASGLSPEGQTRSEVPKVALAVPSSAELAVPLRTLEADVPATSAERRRT